MTIQTNMHEAKTRLSELAALAASGETVIIARAGKPYVQLIPVIISERQPGGYESSITMTSDFDDADNEITSLFGSRQQ